MASVFFFYGLIFFLTGICAIYIRLSNNTKYTLFDNFSYLAGFFLFKAITQWQHLFYPLMYYQLKPSLFVVNIGHRLGSCISALFLLRFAFEVCILLNKRLRYLRGVFFVVSLGFFMYVFVYPTDALVDNIIDWSVFIEKASDSFILFPAGIISSAAIFLYTRKFSFPRFSLYGLRAFAFSIFYYSLHIFFFASNNRHLTQNTFADFIYAQYGLRIEAIEITLALISLLGMLASWIFGSKEETKQHMEIHDGMLLTLEHERIAHDLHDSVVQTLYGITMKIKHLSKSIDNSIQKDSCEEMKRNLSSIHEELASSVVDLRNYIYNNVSDKVEFESIDGAVENIIKESQKISSIKLDYIQENKDLLIPNKNIVIQVYFIIREAVINIIKHSGASQAEIYIKFQPSSIFLRVKDNGIGFKKKQTCGLGLKSIADRVERLQGSFEFRDDNGVVLEINITP